MISIITAPIQLIAPAIKDKTKNRPIADGNSSVSADVADTIKSNTIASSKAITEIRQNVMNFLFIYVSSLISLTVIIPEKLFLF